MNKLIPSKTHVTAEIPGQTVALTPEEVRPTQTQQEQKTDPSKAATTTFQEDLVVAGQRIINLKWEGTQQTIAIMITATALTVCSYIIMWGEQTLKQAAFIFLTNIAFLVIGTYFQRTNHTKIGGIGPQDIGR